MNFKVIGIGGVGCCLVDRLALFLNHRCQGDELVLMDGDEFKEKNRDRQKFNTFGNKAEVKARELSQDYSTVCVRAEPHYVISDNIVSFIREGDTVFLAVDNNATRKLVSDRCEELDNVLLISGGNELTNGGAQAFWRRDRQNMTLPLANAYHANIQRPRDKNPGEVGCDELIESEPQILFMNNLVAAKMLGIFYGYIVKSEIKYDEVYCDLLTGNCLAINRRENFNHLEKLFEGGPNDESGNDKQS